MSLTNSLRLEEILVVDKAPDWERVEFTFTPGEVRQAVEAGPALEMRGGKVAWATGSCKSSRFHSIIFLPTKEDYRAKGWYLAVFMKRHKCKLHYFLDAPCLFVFFVFFDRRDEYNTIDNYG